MLRVTDDAARLLADAEEQIEAWLCELDATWTRLLADARIEATRTVGAAQDEANELLAVARADAAALVADAHAEVTRLVTEAEARAATIVARADDETNRLLAGAGRLASMQLAEAQAEVLKARALATESSATAEALAFAADAAVTGRVQSDDLAALGTALTRLRSELSRVVDAAFDALPAVEATAAALKLDEPITVPDPAPKKPQGFVRRLLRI
jgi:cell division septum initiation protein DivIVA